MLSYVERTSGDSDIYRGVPIALLHAVDRSLQQVLCDLSAASVRARRLIELFSAEDQFAQERTALHLDTRIEGLLRQVCFAVRDVDELDRKLGAAHRAGPSTTRSMDMDARPLPRTTAYDGAAPRPDAQRGGTFPEPPRNGLAVGAHET